MSKLVRDKIPSIIKNAGDPPTTHIAGDQEFVDALKAKLLEEVNEYIESKDPEELADILEVVHTLAKDHHLDPDQLEQLRQKKLGQKGGFDKRIILDQVKPHETD